jgi:hypothetical protein
LDVSTTEKVVHNAPIEQHAKVANFWRKIRHSFSISKLSRFRINWKKSKPHGPRVPVSWTDSAQTAPTAFRQRPPMPCPCPRPRCCRFAAHHFHAATACSGLPSTDSTMPRAPRHCVQPPRTTSCRPPPPDAVPTAVPLRPTTPHHRVHSSGELFPLAAPKWVHHPTALLPGPSPLDLVAKRRQNPAGPPPVPPWPRSLPCLTKMGHQPKWLGQSEAGRPVSARLHSAACHFSMRLKID